MSKTKGILVAVCLCLIVALPTQAGTITVTNTSDSGPASLRQAILDAAPGDVIRFQGSTNRECIRVENSLVIGKPLTIIGRGLEKTLVCHSGSGPRVKWEMSAREGVAAQTKAQPGQPGVSKPRILASIATRSCHGGFRDRRAADGPRNA